MAGNVQRKNWVISIKVFINTKKIRRISTSLLLGCRGKIKNGLIQVGKEKFIKSEGIACLYLWLKLD